MAMSKKAPFNFRDFDSVTSYLELAFEIINSLFETPIFFDQLNAVVIEPADEALERFDSLRRSASGSDHSRSPGVSET